MIECHICLVDKFDSAKYGTLPPAKLPAVPRIGDEMEYQMNMYTVVRVIWQPRFENVVIWLR